MNLWRYGENVKVGFNDLAGALASYEHWATDEDREAFASQTNALGSAIRALFDVLDMNKPSCSFCGASGGVLLVMSPDGSACICDSCAELVNEKMREVQNG